MGYLSHKMDKYDKYNPDERQSKRGLRASKYVCSAITSQVQNVNAIGVGLWLVKLETAS